MNCNCNNINNTDGSGLTAYVSHVYGNVLRLAIPLTLRTVTMENGEMVATDTDFVPSSDYPVTVVFSKGGVKISLEATMQNGNIAYIEDLGTIPVGKYDIAVLCKDDNGNPYRFKQVTALHIVDATADANIPSDIEYEVTTWYLDAAIFLALKGEDGVGIDDIITESSGEIGGMNTITIVLTNGETRTFTVMNGSGQVDSDFNINSPHPLSNSTITAKFNAIDNSIEGLFGGVEYDSQSKTIRFYNKNRSRLLATLDARPFIKDGMVNSVYISNNTLVITFNTDAGREAIGVSLSSIFNPNNYYTKTQVNNLLGDYYNRSEINRLVDNKADLLDEGRIPAIEATPVVLDYIYAPPSGSPIIPINPQAGEVIYFANENKIHRYYYANAGQSGGMPTIVYVEETPSKYLVYFNKDNDKFYRYNAGSLSMVEIETDSGGGYEPPVGGIPKSDLASDVQTSLGKADTALQSQEQADWNQTTTTADDYIKNKPDVPTAISVNQQSYPLNNNHAFVIPDYYTKTQIDNAGYASTADIPTKTSDLTNDSGFLTKVFYKGTCSTSASAMPKVCTVDTFPTTTSGNITHAKDGTIIAVTFGASDTNTTAAPSLNVNSIGAKAISYSNAIVTSEAKNTTIAGTKNNTHYYYYDSTLDSGNGAWVFIVKAPDLNTTYSAMTQAEVDAGSSTTGRIISPKMLRDNFYTEGEVDTLLGNKVDFVIYADKDGMDADISQSNGTIGYDGDLEQFYLYDSFNGEWRRIPLLMDLATVATSGSYADLSNKPTIPTVDSTPTQNSTNAVQSGGVYTALAGKQATLVSGTNIKTVNNTSLLGSGNISIPAGADGKSAYQSYLDTTSDSPVKTEAEWVASLLPTVVSNGDMAIVESEDYIDIFIYEAEIATTPTVIALDGEAEAHKSATLNVVGSHLKADIVVSVPTGFYVGSTGTSTSATLTATGGSVNTSVVIRHSGNNPNTDITGVVITLTSGSLTKTVPLSYTRYAGPTIVADNTLTVKAAAGGSNTATLSVSGVNLTGNITAAISGTNASKFSVSGSPITQSGGSASGTLTITYSPSAGDTSATDASATLTLSSTGATSIQVALTGKVSELFVSPSSLSLSTVANTPTTGVLSIQGRNLSNGVTLALVDSNSVYSLSKNSLTKAEAEAGETITVTYNPTAQGNHTASIAINWDGTTQTVSISGTAAQGLPAGYTEIPYIQGHIKALNTNASSSSQWELDVVCDSMPSSTQILACSNSAGGHYAGALTNGKFGVGASAGQYTSASVTTRTTVVITFSANGISLTANGETVTRTGDAHNNNIKILGSNDNPKYLFEGKCYGIRCLNENFGQFILCKNSSNQQGVYNTKQGVFFNLDIE